MIGLAGCTLQLFVAGGWWVKIRFMLHSLECCCLRLSLDSGTFAWLLRGGQVAGFDCFFFAGPALVYVVYA